MGFPDGLFQGQHYKNTNSKQHIKKQRNIAENYQRGIYRIELKSAHIPHYSGQNETDIAYQYNTTEKY